MKIFLDESGSFTSSTERGSFCVVAAYVVPEATVPQMERALRMLKVESGRSPNSEVKRRDLSNDDVYFRFLDRLSQLNGIAVAVATDSALNGDVTYHQAQQAAKVAENESHMIHPEGKAVGAG